MAALMRSLVTYFGMSASGMWLEMRLVHKVLPGTARTFVRNKAMRGFWGIQRKGLRRLLQALQAKPQGELSAEAALHARRVRMQVNYYERMARYVAPPLDVPLTCLVAEDENPFDADPARWQPWVRNVRVLRIPGTHASSVVAHGEALARALEEAMQFTPILQT